MKGCDMSSINRQWRRRSDPSADGYDPNVAAVENGGFKARRVSWDDKRLRVNSALNLFYLEKSHCFAHCSRVYPQFI